MVSGLPFVILLGQAWLQDHLVAMTENGDVSKVLIWDFHNPEIRVSVVLHTDGREGHLDSPSRLLKLEQRHDVAVGMVSEEEAVEECNVPSMNMVQLVDQDGFLQKH